MASSKEDIASQGLLLLGANPISSFDEGTPEANIVKVMYPDFVRDILSRFPWTFASDKRLLSKLVEAPVNEYRYYYARPAEALTFFAMYDTASINARPYKRFAIFGNKIAANAEQLWAEFSFYQVESEWPSYFVNYAIYAFAAHIAMAITDDLELVQVMNAKAYGTSSAADRGGLFSVATSADSEQEPPDMLMDSPLADARFS